MDLEAEKKRGRKVIVVCLGVMRCLGKCLTEAFTMKSIAFQDSMGEGRGGREVSAPFSGLPVGSSGEKQCCPNLKIDEVEWGVYGNICGW